MKRGVDTNVLIYAHMPGFMEHQAVRRFLLNQLATPDITLVVTANILHEFVHVITDARRFQPPVPISEALAVARLYLGRTNVECTAVDSVSLKAALDLMERHDLGRRRIADTLFAAALDLAGVRQIITCNPKDFELFTNLEIIDPRG